MRRQSIRAGLALVGLGLAAALGGCSPGQPFDDEFAQYGIRSPKVTPTSGNTLAANEAIQTVNPWPAYAYNTDIPVDANLMVKAVSDLESGGGKGGGGTTVNVFSGGNNSVSGVQ